MATEPKRTEISPQTFYFAHYEKYITTHRAEITTDAADLSTSAAGRADKGDCANYGRNGCR